MKIKHGVETNGIRPELILAIMAAQYAYHEAGAELVITSLRDGHHSYTSLHYAGQAVDIRTHHLPRDVNKRKLVQQIRLSLTEDYDVLLEGAGSKNEHIHIEYQPRRRAK